MDTPHLASLSCPDNDVSKYNNDVVKELQREINVVLANRNKRLGWRRLLCDPVIIPYYHFMLAIVCMIVLAASSWTFGIYEVNPNYIIPSFLTESTLQKVINTQTFVFLDVAFAAIGLPLFCDLLMDIMGYFWVEIGEHEKLSFQTIAEKAKEWCLRFQFIVAFAVTSLVRVLGPTDDRKIVLVYLTQHLRVMIMVLFGMFSYTDTFDKTPWEHARSFGISFGLSLAQMMMYFAGVQEQTPSISAINVTGKVLAGCTSACMASLLFYQLYFLFQRVLKPGGLTNLSTKEMCFVVYGSLVGIGTIMISINLSICHFDFYHTTMSMHVSHEVMMLIHSVASTSLPVRIARYDVRRVQGLIRCTQRKVSDTIDSPLRYLMTEMDCLLHSVNFYQNLTHEEIQSLERIVSLCNDVSVSLEEIVDTDLTTTSGSTDREESFYHNNTMRNRHQRRSQQNREQMRVSFDLPIMEEDSDNNSLFERTNNTNKHITRSTNHTDKGYGLSGSAMGDSVLVSSLSQPDDDIESSNGKKASLWLQQFLLQRSTSGNSNSEVDINHDNDDDDNGDDSDSYSLNRRMRVMQESLKKNKRLHEAEHSLRKDREFGQDPEIEAQYDRLAATMRCRQQSLQQQHAMSSGSSCLISDTPIIASKGVDPGVDGVDDPILSIIREDEEDNHLP